MKRQKGFQFVSVFVFILAALVSARFFSGQENPFSIAFADVLVAIAPIVVWMIATEQISELGFGASGLTIKTLRRATNTQLEPGSLITVQKVAIGEKSDDEQLDSYIEQRLPALSFCTNASAKYSNPQFYKKEMVKRYVDVMVEKNSNFRYVIFSDEHDKLVATAGPRSIKRYLSDPDQLIKFTEAINTGRFDELVVGGGGVTGVVLADRLGLTETTTRKEALEVLDKLRLDWAPVVDGVTGEFSGILDRSKLVAELVLAVSNALEGSDQ